MGFFSFRWVARLFETLEKIFNAPYKPTLGKFDDRYYRRGYGSPPPVNGGIPRDSGRSADIPFQTYDGSSGSTHQSRYTDGANGMGYGFAVELFERSSPADLDSYFSGLHARVGRGVYFCRICGYSVKVDRFLKRFYSEASKTGSVIEGRLPEPDENTRADLVRTLGYGFVKEPRFIAHSLTRWLPQTDGRQRSALAAAMYDTLMYLSAQGMTDAAVKNCYIIYMCKLKHSFGRLCPKLGESLPPKILYDGNITIHDLLLMHTLSRAGCDVLLVEYSGDENYMRADPNSEFSELVIDPSMTKFPRGYGIDDMRTVTPESAQMPERETSKKRRRDSSAVPAAATNSWITGYELDDLIVPAGKRGKDDKLFYNIFMRVNGVWDKAAYLNELYLARLELLGRDIRPVIAEFGIPLPNNAEISELGIGSYSDSEDLIADMAAKLGFEDAPGLRRLMTDSFMRIMHGESDRLGGDLSKLTDMAVYMLCWFGRYSGDLLSGWEYGENGCFILLGGCKNMTEAAFLRFLAGLPIDVIILVPDLEQKCCLTDERLHEQNNPDSFRLGSYPIEASQMNMGTAAFYAERELDDILYKGTGLYRNKQHQKANAVILKTMYEEIRILWSNEPKYRQNFSATDDTVNIPVVFSKISGVKDGDVDAYWAQIQELVTDDTILVSFPPLTEQGSLNGLWSDDPCLLKNGRLQRELIKDHRGFKYGFVRDAMIEHMFDKLQLLLDSRIIKGTFTSGAERTIVSAALNLDEYILRKLQSFDFTKTNPKLLYIHTGKQAVTLEDAAVAAYLSLLGCDVVFFVPTGYQSVERHFSIDIMEEHQIGQYLYDLSVPDLRKYAPKKTKRSRFFEKGK